MIKNHPRLKNALAFFVSSIVVSLFAFLALSPSQEVKATVPGQSADTCKTCHSDQHELWSISKHGSVPIDCETCHRLANGEGVHPQLAYSVQSQELTCETCHADKAAEWKSSRHGEINLGCASCHEPHSQQLKTLDDKQLVCANCHKKQFESLHDSTHAAAGVSCKECHLGADSGHSFKATVTSCESCHSDIHEAKQLIAAGVAVEPVATNQAEATAEATMEPAATPAVEKNVEETAKKGGINLPSWLFLIAGLLIGGIGAWVIFGQEPGSPTPEK